MHPDNVLAGLRREAERFPGRKEAIEAEMRRVAALPRPEVAVEEPERTVDRTADHLRALERERARSSEDRHAEIDAEIARVKAQIRSERVGRAISDNGAERAVTEPARRGPGRPRRTEIEE